MKPLLPLAVLLAVGIAGCSKPAPDPYAKYRDVQLKRGMRIADIKQEFGQPDGYSDWWNDGPDDNGRSRGGSRKGSLHKSQEYSHYVEELGYGGFGAHSQKSGHITKHRLSMWFVDGELYSWEKSNPINRE